MIPYNVSQTHAGHLNDSHQVPDYTAATIFTNARRETNAKEKNEEKTLITIILVYKKNWPSSSKFYSKFYEVEVDNHED